MGVKLEPMYRLPLGLVLLAAQFFSHLGLAHLLTGVLVLPVPDVPTLLLMAHYQWPAVTLSRHLGP